MRLLCLSKRAPQQRDLLNSPYGRFFNLPAELAKLGNEVHIALLSHHNEVSEEKYIDDITISSVNARQQPLQYLAHLNRLCRRLKPDWIAGFSDTYYGILAVRLARKHGCRSLIDAYDNYEAYMPWNRPLHWLWRRALKKADRICAAGPTLAALMNEQGERKDCAIVPMAADKDFRKRCKTEARRILQLSDTAKIVTYIGSLSSARDVDSFFSAIPAMPEVQFIASGHSRLAFPEQLNHLGYLKSDQVPLLYCAADVSVITADGNSFGKYAHPVKLYEAMASRTPLICADLPVTRWIAGDQARYYRPGDVDSLVTGIHTQLDEPLTPQSHSCWQDSAKTMNAILTGQR